MKRLLSAILTLALVLSLIPAVFAEDVAPKEQIYTFAASDDFPAGRILAVDKSGDETYKPYKNEINGVQYYIRADILNYTTNRNWKLHDVSDSLVEVAGATTNSGWFAVAKDLLKVECSYLERHADFSLSLRGEQTGFYIPHMSVKSTNANQNIGICLFFKNDSIGNYDTYRGDGENSFVYALKIPTEETQFDGTKAIYTENGKDLLAVFTTNSKRRPSFYNITLTEVQNPQIAITADKSELDTTENTSATITSTTVTGDNQETAMPIGEGFVEYKSSNENVATVDATGKITAVGGGTAKIYAQSPDGLVKSNEITVTVTAPKVGITIVYDIKNNVGIRDDLSVPFSSLTYEKTKGFWAYAANRRYVYSWDENGKDNITTSGEDLNWVREKGIAIRVRSNWWAIMVNVPVSGYYEPKAYYGTYTNGGFNVYMNYYMLPITESGASVDLAETAFATEENLIGRINCTNENVESGTLAEMPKPFKEKYFEKGEYYVVFYPTCTDEGASGTLRGLVSDFVLDGGDDLAPMVSTLNATEENGELKVSATSTLMSDAETPAEDVVITYSIASGYENIATIDASTGVITKIADSGSVKVIATATKGDYSSSRSIMVKIPEAEDEALKEAFKVEETPMTDYVAPSVVSVSAGGSVITPEKNTDGSYNIEAAEENKDGAKFLYWAKGLKANKKIVSFSNKLENYVPEEDGADWLIAVYDDMLPAKDEYYNANGQLIATGEKPALPSMAGYGEASDWNRYGETNIYVAEYSGKTQPDDVEVTVNGEMKKVPYGTEITCTATDANFKCWTKSNINGKTEIVSTENVYKFKAWEDCSVDAVNEAYNYNGDMFKIVVDSFEAGNETGIMAEFIGFGSNVVEKGIMWNGNKIAMTKPGSQFSVVADKNGEYKGYAIVGDATDGYTLITDGSVTVSDAE